MPLQRPRQPPKGRCRRAIRLLFPDPDAARPAGGCSQRPDLDSTPITPPRNTNLAEYDHDQPPRRLGSNAPSSRGQRLPGTATGRHLPVLCRGDRNELGYYLIVDAHAHAASPLGKTLVNAEVVGDRMHAYEPKDQHHDRDRAEGGRNHTKAPDSIEHELPRATCKPPGP